MPAFRHTLPLCAIVLVALLAGSRAFARPPVPEGDRSGPSHTPAPEHRGGVGITAGRGDSGIGVLMTGLDGWFRVNPYLSVGLEATAFVVDNGADPQYCEGCLGGGKTLSAFAEGRLFGEEVLSGFARVGLGAAFVDIIREDPPEESHVEPALQIALGPQLTVWHVFVRARGTATVMPVDSFLGYGAELGAVF